jgi:hypothetical protein
MSVGLVKGKYSLALCSLLAQRKFKVKQFMRIIKNAKFIRKIVKFLLSYVLLLIKVEEFEVQIFFSEAFSIKF